MKQKKDKEWEKHPDQHVQEEWMEFLKEGPLTADGYKTFVKWWEGYVKERNLEGYR